MERKREIKGEVQVKNWINLGDKLIKRYFDTDKFPVDPEVDYELNKAWGIVKDYMK